MSEIRRYSGRRSLDGERVEIKTLFGKEIVIIDFVVLPSQYEGKDDFLMVQAEADGKLVTFPCGSIAAGQLKEDREKGGTYPMRAVISKPKGKKYYVLEEPKK